MKNVVLLLALALATSTTSCEDSCNEPASSTTELLKCWTHSYEEETQTGTELFRPCDYKEFGPSHYRQRMILKEDDQASYLQASPVDAHTMVDGTWQYHDQTETLQILDSTGIIVWNYKVILVAEDQLVLRHIP